MTYMLKQLYLSEDKIKIPKQMSEDLKFHVFKDGSDFCAVLPDFKDLQESPAGFGKTKWHAIMDLISQKELGSIAYELL